MVKIVTAEQPPALGTGGLIYTSYLENRKDAISLQESFHLVGRSPFELISLKQARHYSHTV